MSKFRSKIVEIEAMQLSGDDLVAVAAKIVFWAEGHGVAIEIGHSDDHIKDLLRIPTPEGVMTANKGDWIIRGTIGEFYPCKDEVFQRKYEASDT